MKRKMRIDLHVHSCYSHDGFITIKQLDRFFKKHTDFIIAITDHDKIEGALAAHNIFGDKIIVGEEIKTKEGEIIGLYLTRFIKPHMSMKRTIEAIKSQGGLVMVPHPYKRTGNSDSPISENALNMYINDFDIIEIFNARNRTYGANKKAFEFALNNNKPKAVGSDAHSIFELGRSYVNIHSYTGKDALLAQLASDEYICRPISFSYRILTKIQREIKKLK